MTILLSLLLLRVYVLQHRAVWDLKFVSLWLPDSATICDTLSIHHAQFLTNEMVGAPNCHIARTMNFVCSIFPDCRLWIENSALFHHLSSAWIPEVINAAIAACFVFAINLLSLMIIAFITIKSSLVPLIEGLCAQIYCRFEISVVCSHLLLFFFCERKNMLKENKKAVSPDFYL